MSDVLFDAPGPRTRARQRTYTVLSLLVVAAVTALALRELWQQEQITPDKWEAYTNPTIIMAMLEGLLETLMAAAVAIVLAVAFGAVFAAGKLSDRAWLRWPSWLVVEFFRAVPVLLLIVFIFLGYGSFLGAFWSLVLALMLYNGSVLAEIFRAGMQAVPRGQSEAAYAIGMRKSQVMRLVLAPQALRTMLPAIISQCIVALKDTALGIAIGYAGIVDVGNRVAISPLYRNPFVTAVVLAAVFIVINYSLSRLAIFLEGRLRRQGKKVVHVTPGTDPTA